MLQFKKEKKEFFNVVQQRQEYEKKILRDKKEKEGNRWEKEARLQFEQKLLELGTANR